MKKFNFPFQRVMDWRERVAENEKLELDRLSQAREELQQSRANVRSTMDDVRRSPGETEVMAAEDLHKLAAFSVSLHNLDRRLHAEEQKCGTQIEAQKERCVQADRQYKLLAQLHDSSRRQWTYEVDRALETSAAENWNAARAREVARGSQSGD